MFGKTNIAGLTLAALVGLTFTNAAQAQYRHYRHHRYDAYKHLDDLAVVLERQTEDLHKEVHLRFRNTPSYRHLDDDVAEMEKLARHIHDVAHRRGSIRHLRSDVEELDKLFHHIEDLVYRMMRTRRIGSFQYVAFRTHMSRIGRTLHHMRDDLRHLDHRTHYHSRFSFGG